VIGDLDVISAGSQVVSVALLLGIFLRLGGLSAQVVNLTDRVRTLEGWRERLNGQPPAT
jgi:hypothetical protein